MKHLAIIADGNRRWAAKCGLPAVVGHAQGLVAIENACLWAVDHSISYLTMYCFSTENWKRTQEEVDNIFDLARAYFNNRLDWYVENNIKVRFCGRRDRLPCDILSIFESVESETCNCTALMLMICIDYGGRDEIARAAADGAVTEEAFNNALCGNSPEPDMILRTGGRHRLSNFLLWQAAYSEIYFTDTLFPAMDEAELDEALEWYEKQIRTFGR